MRGKSDPFEEPCELNANYSFQVTQEGTRERMPTRIERFYERYPLWHLHVIKLGRLAEKVSMYRR